MRRDFESLERVHAAHKAASAAFPPAEGASIKEMNPAAAEAAIVAESEAADHAQASSCSGSLAWLLLVALKAACTGELR
jgi:hypothetical protein